MHIDESSLEGTLGAMSTIFWDTSELAEDDMKKHGLVICAGDQLSLALLDKVCICISVVSLLDYLIRSRPFDATTTTSWTHVGLYRGSGWSPPHQILAHSYDRK